MERGLPDAVEADHRVEGVVLERREIARGEPGRLGGEVDALAHGARGEESVAVDAVAVGTARGRARHHQGGGRGPRLVLPEAGGDERLAWHIFEALGRTAILEERLMDAVTAVSGSGPAYVYLLAELMEKAARKIGLDEAAAQLLVVQTIIGAGRMLRDTGLEPAERRRVVTPPGGTTAAAMDVITRQDLPGVFIEALTAARDRGAELGRSAGV